MQLMSAAGCSGQGPQPAWPCYPSQCSLPSVVTIFLTPQTSLSDFTEAFALLERSKERPPCLFRRGVCVEGVSMCLLVDFCRAAAFLFISGTSQM